VPPGDVTETVSDAPSPELDAAVSEHAGRGVRLQLLVRFVLVAFVAVTVGVVPPVQGATACYAIVAAYAIWSLGFGLWARRGGPRVAGRAWLALFVDLLVLAAVTLVSGVAADQSWTANVLVNGFFLIPVLAATQLRPDVCAAVVVPTVLVYLASSIATQTANDEPWASIALRTVVLAGLGAACIGLTRIQQSRVRTIAELLRERTGLLDDLVHLEERERRELSERLHDGALQYVLAARQDLDDLRASADSDAGARVEHALSETSRLLRSAVTELHPAVLEHAGLAKALRALAEAQSRPGCSVEIELHDWPEGGRTSVDTLLYGVARELLANALKHAAATEVRLALGLYGGTARLVVADDGRGIPEGALAESIERGHVGLHSQTLRVQAAGGALTISAARPSGTVVTVEVPAQPTDAIPSAAGTSSSAATTRAP
jgi:two-component system NarL family sensor kinase